MDLIALYILGGALIGFAIGMTGVGGGSLMTPFLLFSGIPLPIAIGTDLIYAAITKAGSVIMHYRLGTIRWRFVFYLLAGSLPMALATIIVLRVFFGDAQHYQNVMQVSLGGALIGTALLLLVRGAIRERLRAFHNRFYIAITRNAAPVLIISGMVLGVMVTLSSVGAGVIGTAILMILCRKLLPIQVIGTELAHAVPLTLCAGLGHGILLANIDWLLLVTLLVGSIPAVFLGTHFSHALPEKLLQWILIFILFSIGCYLIITL